VEDAALGVLRTHTSGASFSTGHLRVRKAEGRGGWGVTPQVQAHSVRSVVLCRLLPVTSSYYFTGNLLEPTANKHSKRRRGASKKKEKENSRRRSFVKGPPQAEAELLDRRVSGRRAPERPELSPPAVEHFAPVVVARGGGGWIQARGYKFNF
jgi:hypothetical protein